jgi:hypothetical protein
VCRVGGGGVRTRRRGGQAAVDTDMHDGRARRAKARFSIRVGKRAGGRGVANDPYLACSGGHL